MLKNPKIGIAFAESLLGKSKDAIVSEYPEYFDSKANINSALQAFTRPSNERAYKDFIDPIFQEIGLDIDEVSGLKKWNWLQKILEDPHGYELPKPEKEKVRYQEPKDLGFTDYDDLYANLEEEEMQALMEAVIKRIKKELL
jgi:hypothetical protein